MTPQTTPIRLNLKKDEKLEIDWQDGVRGVYSISYLRAMCPCAQCKLVREGEKKAAAFSILCNATGPKAAFDNKTMKRIQEDVVKILDSEMK